MQFFTLVVIAALAVSAHASLVNSKFLVHARKDVNRFQAVLRGAVKAHAARAQDMPHNDGSVCGNYIYGLIQQCTAWHDQLENPDLDFETFCADPCWVSASMPNNTACLLQEKEIAADIQLLKVACSRRGPNNTYCGSVIMKIKDTNTCSQYNQQNCVNPEREGVACEWNGDHCDVAITKPYLDQVCSPCISDLAKGLANLVNASDNYQDNDQNNVVAQSEVLNRFQQLLCVQVNDKYCAVDVKQILSSLTDGRGSGSGSGSGSGGDGGLNNTQLNGLCAETTAPTCLRKMLPAVASIMKQDILKEASYCAMNYASYSGNDFHTRVQASCLPCYLNRVVDVRRVLSFADNLCTKSDSGTYCLSLLDFHPSEALETCYVNTASTGTCSANCNTVFNNFFDTYGCCFGIFTQTLNKTRLVSQQDVIEFWGAADAGKREANDRNSHNGGNMGENSFAPMGSLAPMGSFGGENMCGGGEDDSPDLTKLEVCASLTDIRTRMNTFCAYTRATLKIAKAISLKLNCTAVTENEEIKNAIVLSIVRDIAQNLGLPVDAITGVLFICPTDAPAAHHFRVQVAGAATLQFVIQSDNAALTTAAAAQLDTALTNGTLSFPALTATVSSVCTTCATEADLVNLAAAAPLVPTPAPPAPTTSAASSFQLLATVVILLFSYVVVHPF